MSSPLVWSLALDPDPFVAGRDLALAAGAGGLILGFASADRLVPELDHGLRLHRAAHPVRSVLVSGDGILHGHGGADFGVVALVIPHPFAVTTCALDRLATDLPRARAELTAQLGAAPGLALAFAPSGSVDGASIATALAQHLPCPVVGGLAGDHGRLVGNRSSILVDGRLLGKELVVIGLPASTAFWISTCHGGRPLGDPGIVEAASGQDLWRISGQTAQEFIASRFSHPLGALELGTLPLEILAPDGERQLRTPELLLTDGGIRFFGGFSVGDRVQVVEVDRAILEQHNAEKTATFPAATLKPTAMIAISCAARSWLLGASAKGRELANVLAPLGLPDLPTIGLISFGEFGPAVADAQHQRPTRFHNCSLVTLILGERA